MDIQTLLSKYEKLLAKAKSDLNPKGYSGATVIRVHYMEEIIKDLKSLAVKLENS